MNATTLVLCGRGSSNI